MSDEWKQPVALSVVFAIYADVISYKGAGKFLYSIFGDEILARRP